MVYDFILSHKLLTAIAALYLTGFACVLIGHRHLWWRVMAYQLSPALAAAFFFVTLFSGLQVSGVDAASGLVFEFGVLLFNCLLFARLYQTVAFIDTSDTKRLLRISIVLQLLTAIPLLTSQGFGLFSEGSRIEYLSGSSSAKYFTYMGLLISLLQAPLIANRLTQSGKLGASGIVAIALNFALSVLAGSKGGVFLWLLSVTAMIDYRRTPISLFAVVTIAVSGCALVVGSSIVVANFLDLSLREFADIVLSRFFLNNDARALAFDQRMPASAETSLFTESFRSLARIFGSPPRDSPLGILLYDELLGFETGNGANASLMALVVYYSPRGYAALSAIAALCGAGILVAFFRVVLGSLRNRAMKAILLAFALTALQQYSQDFLAFQVTMPLIVVAIVALWLYDRQRFGPDYKLRDHQQTATPDRRHSRA